MKTLPVLHDAPSPLPPLYAAWVAELLDGPLPHEPHATCSSCAMLAPADTAASPRSVYFNVETTCCTYHPSLPNFLAGRVLADSSINPALGADVLAARVAARSSVTPLGLDAPEARRARYIEASKAGAFGRSLELRCPHYRVGRGENCGIWRHRNATCATWYCKHVRGARGAIFWKRLRDLIALAEARLARWCALELGVDDVAFARMLAPSSIEGERGVASGEHSEAWYRQIWGPWMDREAEFYQACAAKVETLRWAEVEAICGFDATLHVRLVRHAARAREDEALPLALKLGAVEASATDADGTTIVRGYSDYDPLRLPRDLLDLLARFDGRATNEVLSELRSEGAELEPALIATLADYEILVPAKD